MNKIIWLAVFGFIVLAGWYFYFNPGLNVAPSGSVISTPPNSQNHTVEIINNAFAPQVIKIKKGDSVTWINRMASSSWPASNIHPVHAAYPEPGGCISSKFDACRSLRQGESFTFIFNKVGSWKYHDHLNAATVKPGTVEVSE